MRKPLIIILIISGVLLAGVFGFSKTALSPVKDASEDTNASDTTPTVTVPEFDKKKYSITDPASLWVIASKPRQLNPKEYVPAGLVTPEVPLRSSAASDEMKLRSDAAKALEELVAAGKAAGVQLKLASGYRSYNTQVIVYNNEVRQYGKATADSQSARPGHSEHQTGLGADLQDVAGRCVVADCFKDLPEGKWLAEHAWEHGFIIRYPEGKQAITGYRYEPWHIRFVGKELAAELQKTNTHTLEEFFNVVEPLPY